MTGRYYVLIKRRGTKRYLGAIPIKPGAPVKKVHGLVKKNLNKAYDFKIVSDSVLRALVAKLLPRGRKMGSSTPASYGGGGGYRKKKWIPYAQWKRLHPRRYSRFRRRY